MEFFNPHGLNPVFLVFVRPHGLEEYFFGPASLKPDFSGPKKLNPVSVGSHGVNADFSSRRSEFLFFGPHILNSDTVRPHRPSTPFGLYPDFSVNPLIFRISPVHSV